MIGHDSECIQLKLPSDTGGFEPLRSHNLAALIFLHLVINDPAKHTLFPERAERDVIGARQRVVVIA